MTTVAVHPLKAIPPELRLLAIGKDDDPSAIGGGLAIGDPVTGGGANRILFIDGGQGGTDYYALLIAA